MLQDVSVIKFMLAVVFVVFLSISFGMQLNSTKGKGIINQWFQKALAHFMKLNDESENDRE